MQYDTFMRQQRSLAKCEYVNALYLSIVKNEYK